MLFFYSKLECKKSWKNSTSRSLFWTHTREKIPILHGSIEKSK